MERCCAKPENRVVIAASQEHRTETTQCVVCDRKHYEMTIDPTRFLAQTARVG